MPSARASFPVRIILAFGVGFVAVGWGLHALTTHLLPTVDVASFRIGAILTGLLSGALAFSLARVWRSKSLEREHQLNHGIFSNAAHSIISTDPDGMVEAFSSGAERLLGYRSNDVVGRLNYAGFHLASEIAEHADKLSRELHRPIPCGFAGLVATARKSGPFDEREWTYIRQDGTRVPVRVSITAMRDGQGDITGYLAIASDVTQQRLAEERRRELDLRLSKIASQVPGMVFQFKQAADGRRSFPYASEGIRQIYRLEPSAVAEDSSAIWDLIHPEDVERLAQSIEKSATSLSRWECEYRTRFPDGAEHWVSGTAVPERQEDGAVIWQGFIKDVTERKRAEQTHEESRVLLQSVFSTVDLGVFVIDVTNAGEFRFVEINPAYERMIGIGAPEVRGRSPRELVPRIPAEMAEGLRTNFRRGIESEGPIECEEPVLIHGRVLWWLTRLTPLRDSVGNVVRLVGRSFDITERKTIELRFQSLTERLQLATEAAQVGIWDYDLAQERVVWDSRMHELYGIQAAGFDGSPEAWRARVHPKDLERVMQETSDAQRDGKPFNSSYRIIRPDGEEREIRACAHVQMDAAGRPTRMVGVNWDVTAERRSQSEILRARDQAERLNRQLEEALARSNRLAQEAAAATVAKSEFLANMSHEIRTPLNAVIGMSGLLLGGDLSKEQREFAETIRSSGDALLGLLNDILDYSKIESGHLDLEVRAFDLRTCIESALDVLAGRAAEKGIDLLCAVDAAVPVAVAGDDTRLRQVLVNLLSNAVKFTSNGEVFLSVSVVNAPGENVRLRFAVHDSGIGIPADRMDRLFKSFSQVDASTTRQFGGTGLGLAICKRIVDLMGGRIWVESTGETGSVFCFEVSMHSVVSKASPPRPTVLHGRRVLIVDDSPRSRRILADHCAGWGMVSRAVASGGEALALLAQEHAFDVALIDLEMPDMTGLDLVAALRRNWSAFQLPVAMLTRRGRPRVPDDLGVASVLSKPIRAAALFELCAELLHSGHVRRADSRAEGTAPGVARPLSILLAEDNPVNQRVAILMLRRLGYRADLAGNGREVLVALERQRYDLVLMDVQMPEMDGLQAAREINGRLGANRPRIVAMTANASTSDRENCFAAGMDDFLSKPVCSADLRKAILATPMRYVASAA